MQLTTLIFLCREGEVLLAMKKRGFGAGRWNGAGGKIEPGEEVKISATREVREELSVEVNPTDLKKVAEIAFNFSKKPEWNQFCQVFLVSKWQGEPRETEEMNPKWFKKEALPFDSMWPDDAGWLPQVLRGELVRAKFIFIDDGNKFSNSKVEIVESF